MLYVKKSLNSTSKFNTIDTPEFHKLVQIENMYLDVSKLKSLNFEPLYDIKKGLNQILKGYKNEQ
jgi:nucleoside-diphosphate-sugar epimerase